MGKNKHKNKGPQKRKKNKWSDCKGTRAHFAPKFWRYCLLATNLPENFDENRLKKFILDTDGKGFIVQKKMRSNWNERVAQFQFKMRNGREKAILRLGGIQWEGKKIYLERVGDIFDNLRPRPRTIEGYGIVITFEKPSTQDGLPLKDALKSKGICFRRGLKAVHNSLLILPDKAFLAFETEADQEKAIRLVEGLKYVEGIGFLRVQKQTDQFRETFVSYVEDDWDDISRGPLEREEGKGESGGEENSEAKGESGGEEWKSEAKGESGGEEEDDREGDQSDDEEVADQCSEAFEENRDSVNEDSEEDIEAQGSVYSSTVPQASSSAEFASQSTEIGPFCICIANLPENSNVEKVKHWCKKMSKVKPKKKSRFINNILQLRYDPASNRDKAFRALSGSSWNGKKLIVVITEDVLQYHKQALKFDGYPIKITNFGRGCIFKATGLKELLMSKGIYDLSIVERMPLFRKECAFVSFRTSEDQETAIRRLDGLKCELGNPNLNVTIAESEYVDERPQNQGQGQNYGVPTKSYSTMPPPPVQQRYFQPSQFQQSYDNQNSQLFSGYQSVQQFTPDNFNQQVSGNQGFQQFHGNRDNFQQSSRNSTDFRQSGGNRDNFQQSSGNRDNFQQFSGNWDNFQQSSGNRDNFRQFSGNQDSSYRYGMGNGPPNTYHSGNDRGNGDNFQRNDNNDYSRGQEGGYSYENRNRSSGVDGFWSDSYSGDGGDDRDYDNRKRDGPGGYGDYQDRGGPKRSREGQTQYGQGQHRYDSRY